MNRRSTIILPKCKIEFNELDFDYPFSRGYRYKVITNKSRQNLKNAVEKLAWFFKRECGYDFIQYSKNNDDAEVFLLINTDIDECFGGICFRLQDTTYSDGSNNKKWWLDWAWIHPYYRNKGFFSKLIPTFKDCYSNFIISWPRSKAMLSLIDKYDLDGIKNLDFKREYEESDNKSN